ncbi:two-component system response regulator [Paenibacillus sp. 32O-W]|uniref:response regulator transcription factor n=1 Tax=Paenibacillus sp. 32O-W TaxID=1695218 RepID=UPI0007201AF9|nr:response regulator transcription factor [Paenibacillus sp. 32O-W]ALS29072.1 two-component system response regulator [Paenibacillus sp. 32O-W]
MRRLFIVDDEPFILEGLSTVIDWEEFGITVSGKAASGPEAFEALRHTGADILMTDIMMPEMSGLELIGKLKPLFPDMKYIVLSGYNEFEYVKEGMRLGIENYLLKPVNIKELTETVASTVQKLENADRQAFVRQSELDILRDNVMNRWVTGKIDPTELKTRLQLLDIPADNPFYAVATIKLVASGDGGSPEGDAGSAAGLREPEDGNEAYRVSRALADGAAGNVCCFRDLDGDVILIFTGPAPEAGQAEALALLDRIRQQLRKPGIQALITLGSAESGYLGVSQSYDHAKRLQEYFLTNAGDDIIRYDRMAAADAKAGSAAVDLLEYEQLLLAKDKRAVYAYIDKLFADLQSMETVSPAHIHNCAVDLILCTKQVVRDNKLNHELATSGYKQLFTALFKAHTIGQLVAHVKFIVGSAIDYLSVEEDEFSPVVKQVLRHIETRYAEELSLKTLAQSLNIHPFYLGQLFQKETGKSFSDYVNSFRIKKAQKLLKTTAMKTSDISRHIGYLEPGYFYKQFKKYTGVSPTEYRSGRS